MTDTTNPNARQEARKWPWVLVLVLFIVLSALAVGTSPALTERPEDNVLLPPFEAPSIASIIPDDEVIAATVPVPMIRVQNRPPSTRMYDLNTTLAQDTRDALIDQAWARRWRSFDQQTEVVVVVEVMQTRDLTPLTAKCTVEEPFEVPGADVAGVDQRVAAAVRGCALVVRGRIHVVTAVTVPPSGEDTLQAAMTDIVAHIEPQLPDLPDNPSGEFFSRQRIQILRLELAAVIAVLAIVVLVPLLRDRSLWRRFVTRWAPGRLNPLHLDVEPERRTWSLRAWAIGAARLALFLWVLRLTAMTTVLSSPSATTGLLSMAYVLGLLGQRWLTRSPTPRRPMLRGAALVPALLGLAGTIVMLGLTWMAWTAGSGFLGVSSGTAELATWEVVGAGTFFMVIAVIALIWSGFPMQLGRRFAMAAMRNRRRGEGQPVLMLRTFGDDQLKLRVRRQDRAGFVDSLIMKRRERFEELTASMLSAYGPPIAVGQPGQLLPPGLGAQRFTFDDNDWQDAVHQFAEEAVIVSVFIGKTAGLSWELDLVASSGYLHKTIFLVPPVGRSERAQRLEVFADAYDLPLEVFDTQTTRRVPLAICWPRGWARPLVVSASSADDISYEIAIQRCADALLGRNALPGPTDGPIALPVYRDLGLLAAPPPSGWLSNPHTVGKVWLVNIGLTVAASLLIPLLTGDPIGTEEPAVRIIPLTDEYSVTSTLGGSGSTGYAIVNSTLLVRGDFDSQEISVVAELESPSLDVVMQGDSVYYLGSGMTDTPLMAAAVDRDSGDHIWRFPLDELTPGLAAGEASVFVTQPLQRSLLVLDSTTGELTDEVSLGCRPWGVASHGQEALVACPEEGVLLRIADGVVKSEQQVPSGTTDVLLAGEGELAYVPAESMIENINNGSVIHLTVAEPALDESELGLLIAGVDRVSLFTSETVIRRNARAGITSVAISDDDLSLHYAQSTNWLQLLLIE